MGVIYIPVLNNDVQPEGEALTLNPLLSTKLGGNSGLLSISLATCFVTAP
jgi:hypothetical protein